MAVNPYGKHGLLLRALLASLLLHALLLLQPGIDAHHGSDHGAALNALIVPAAGADTDPSSLQSPSPSPQRAKPLPVADKIAPRISARQVPALARSAEDALASSAENNAAAGSQSPGSQSDAGVSLAATATQVAATGGDAAGTAGNVSEAKSAYLFALAAAARRVKKYPRQALAAGWSGTAQISVRISLGGIAQAPQLRQSSGYADIDQGALSMVSSALRQTPVPDNLKSQEFDIVLPVTFSIDEQ